MAFRCTLIVCICLISTIFCELDCPAEGFYGTNSDDCRLFYYCIETADGYFPIKYECASEERFSQTEQKCIAAELVECEKTSSADDTQDVTTGTFVCPTKGYFPSVRSTDCTSYIMCKFGERGNLEPVLRHCPPSTVYSWSEKRCVKKLSFGCPSRTLSPEPVQDESVAVTSHSFVCPAPGRYFNPTSIDCSEYYICSIDSDEVLIATSIRCPEGTVFGPEQKRCVAMAIYSCPTSSTTPSSSTAAAESASQAAEFVCLSTGRYPDLTSADCSSYFLCIHSESTGGLTAIQTRCPGSTVYSWDEHRCVLRDQFECPNAKPTEQTTTTVLTTPEPEVVYECAEVGRFPNYDSSDCDTYFLCSLTTDGDIVGSLASCPNNTLFSWDLKRCVPSSLYTCPSKTVSTTDSTVLTSTLPTTEKFTCTTTGRFPNEESEDCKSYKYCLQTATGELLEYVFNCPAGSFFDPEAYRCSASYTCLYTTTPATAAPTTITTTSAPHICTEDGRFPNPGTCDTYIYCLKAADQTMLMYVFKCPLGTQFNPHESRCTSDYVCEQPF